MNLNQRFSTRPSDLLPWADPYIARLVTRLQNEVRHERGGDSRQLNVGATQLELDPPGPRSEPDWEWTDDSRWTPSDDGWRES